MSQVVPGILLVIVIGPRLEESVFFSLSLFTSVVPSTASNHHDLEDGPLREEAYTRDGRARAWKEPIWSLPLL